MGKDTSDGSRITIKFKLTADPRGDPTADERRAMDAVARATETVGALRTPEVSLSSAVDTGTNVVTELQAFETTWDVLLQRIDILNTVMAEIAQVGRPHRLHCSWSHRDADSPVCVASLVRYINCNQSLSVIQCLYCR